MLSDIIYSNFIQSDVTLFNIILFDIISYINSLSDVAISSSIRSDITLSNILMIGYLIRIILYDITMASVILAARKLSNVTPSNCLLCDIT